MFYVFSTVQIYGLSSSIIRTLHLFLLRLYIVSTLWREHRHKCLFSCDCRDERFQIRRNQGVRLSERRIWCCSNLWWSVQPLRSAVGVSDQLFLLQKDLQYVKQVIIFIFYILCSYVWNYSTMWTEHLWHKLSSIVSFLSFLFIIVRLKQVVESMR